MSPKLMLHLYIKKLCPDCHLTHQDTYNTITFPSVFSHGTYFSWLTKAPSPPYNSLKDYFRDRPRQIARGARKATSLPATSDVDELARLILALRSSLETHLGGHKISGAAVTIPLLAALYQEDLEDAFEYAGLLYIPHYPYWYGSLFHETSAVYVGNGFGLCSNYTDPIGCERERKNPLHQPINENVLSVSYTRHQKGCGFHTLLLKVL